MVEKRVKQFGQGPPPLFEQCPKEIDFSPVRCSLTTIDSDPTTTDLCKRFNNLQLAFLAHSDLVTVRAFSETRGFSFAPLMISKPENIPCMTTTTTDGGSICVKVMRQLRCR